MQNGGTGFFGHPRGLATLFFTEMWERFSYYGMRALLILFMTAPESTGGLGFSVVKAGAIYGLYTAMVYLMNLPGGWVADRFFGQRRAVLYGGFLIIAGQACLMLPSTSTFYLGLILLMLGTGMLKSNVSTIVGQLYGPTDRRRDAGFSIFYMGINLGALISPLICGWIGEKVSWRLGFGIAGLGMVVGVVQYVFGWKYLGDCGLPPTDTKPKERQGALLITGAVIGIGVLLTVLAQNGTIDITPEIISNTLGVLLVVMSIAVFTWLIFGAGWSPIERQRSSAILVLFLASVMFWAIFEQAGSSLNLFAERSTDNSLFGFSFPASWLQAVQPILVVALSPVFAAIWIKLGDREPSSPAKFSIGLFLVGVGFVVLVPAAIKAATGVRVSPLWLTTTYTIHTLGELCLSPVGLSAMTKLAPTRVAGMMMGVFFLSIGVGNFLAGRAASLYETLPLTTLFGGVGVFVIVASLGMMLMVRPTVRLMGGVK